MGTFNETNTWRRFNRYHTQLSTSYDDYYFVSNLVPRAFPLSGWGGKRPWHRLVTCTA